MDVRLLRAKISNSLRQEGPAATIRRAIRQLRRGRDIDEFDARYGTDTGGDVPLWNLEIKSSNARFGVRYQPTTESELSEAVKFLRIDPSRFSFVDLGCGKGRTLLIAANLGFKEVIGIEFAAELVTTARANLAKVRIANGRVDHGDAAEHQFPPDNLVVYFYNPFAEEVMIKVINNLGDRITHGRSDEIYVVYKVPNCAAVLDSASFLKQVGCPANYPYIKIWKAGS